ncbi:arginine--tRNA ligase [Pirellulaceae bacterium]|nr:arginine--tRNA ligase [Pirellulaceae bacterium]
MSLISEIKCRFEDVLSHYHDDVAKLLDMLKPSQDEKFGDYQLNCAMALGKQLRRPPREVATEILEKVNLEGICEKMEVAGPGFINLTLDQRFVVAEVKKAIADNRLGVQAASEPKTVVIDFSSPNVAKPMHVGHIRSTVIGDSLCRVLRFLGHQVITDNHLGDWGTQFGMIIYGYKHFSNSEDYQTNPVPELSRIYRYVRRLMDYFEKQGQRPKLQNEHKALALKLEELNSAEAKDAKEEKKQAKSIRSLRNKIAATESMTVALEEYFSLVQDDADFQLDVKEHQNIATAVLEETARLHEGDSENTSLWQQFMPHCREEIQRIYSRLNIEFDHEFGESHYHSMLQGIVDEFKENHLAEESEGALCVFLDGFEAPMIIQKRDGAFLYSTTDLATIRFRMKTWDPDLVLYVVDHRQSDHFEKLFSAAKKWGYTEPRFFQVSFGTVMGEDGKPYKTRSGDTVGLEGLLDHAVEEAHRLVQGVNQKRKPEDQLSKDECFDVANVVGLGGLKYADLSQHRGSDYVFSYEKMLALKGDTAPYVQYSYARVHGIFRKGKFDPNQRTEELVSNLNLEAIAERALAIKLLRFEEALQEVLIEYKPNILTNYLFELSQQFAVFFEQCPVLKADTEQQKQSRFLLCDLTARTIEKGLSLLGIEVRKKM